MVTPEEMQELQGQVRRVTERVEATEGLTGLRGDEWSGLWLWTARSEVDEAQGIMREVEAAITSGEDGKANRLFGSVQNRLADARLSLRIARMTEDEYDRLTPEEFARLMREQR